MTSHLPVATQLARPQVPLPVTKTIGSPSGRSASTLLDGTDDWTVPDAVRNNPLFVQVGKNGMIGALQQLDQNMRKLNIGHLISGKKPRHFMGKQIETGMIGLYDNNGQPRLTVTPGLYLNFSPVHTFRGKADMTGHVEFLGLTMAQVGQSEALVVQDPQNRVFVIRNGGFAAYGVQGRFKVLAVVDILNLGKENAFIEPGTGTILGWKKEIKRKVETQKGIVDVTVATFFNVPANNVVIVQQFNDLISLGAGQHVITNPNTTFRSFYSLSERQHSFKTRPAYTVEGVPVVLNLNLRYRVIDPIVLSANYNSPLEALINPSQTVVNSVVSRLSYQQFMKARKVSEDTTDKELPWIAEFKMECLNELSDQSKLYGLVVESFDMMDRCLEGALGQDLERQAERVLQNQVEATQVELRNQIKAGEERGVLAVTVVKAEAERTIADTQYYNDTKVADAAYYKRMKEAKAEAEASKLLAEQEAENIMTIAKARMMEIELQGKTYAAVPQGHAQQIQHALIDVQRRQALPAKTIWFEGSQSEGVRQGFEVATGVALAGGESRFDVKKTA